jgi:hypothetical protein
MLVTQPRWPFRLARCVRVSAIVPAARTGGGGGRRVSSGGRRAASGAQRRRAAAPAAAVRPRAGYRRPFSLLRRHLPPAPDAQAGRAPGAAVARRRRGRGPTPRPRRPGAPSQSHGRAVPVAMAAPPPALPARPAGAARGPPGGPAEPRRTWLIRLCTRYGRRKGARAGARSGMGPPSGRGRGRQGGGGRLGAARRRKGRTTHRSHAQNSRAPQAVHALDPPGPLVARSPIRPAPRPGSSAGPQQQVGAPLQARAPGGAAPRLAPRMRAARRARGGVRGRGELAARGPACSGRRDAAPDLTPPASPAP